MENETVNFKKMLREKPYILETYTDKKAFNGSPQYKLSIKMDKDAGFSSVYGLDIETDWIEGDRRIVLRKNIFLRQGEV